MDFFSLEVNRENRGGTLADVWQMFKYVKLKEECVPFSLLTLWPVSS